MKTTLRLAAVLALGIVAAGCVEYRVDPVTGKEYKVEKKGDPEMDRVQAQLDENPDDARAWYALGDLYERRGQYVDALQAYMKMQEVIAKLEKEQHRRYTGGLYKIGETLVRLHRYPEAERYLKQVIARQPKDKRQAVLNLNYRNAHKLLAAIYQFLNEWDAAEEHALAFRRLGGGNECDGILSEAAARRRSRVVESGYQESEKKAPVAPAGAKSPTPKASDGDTPRK